MKKITGSIVAIVTPMQKDCSLDTASLNELIEKKNNALDLLKVKRFLYLVDPDTFIPHEKGNNIKYFSQVPTMIMDKEKISNVYKKLKDVGILNN